MKKIITSIFFACLLSTTGHASSLRDVRFHDITNDTTHINEILDKASSIKYDNLSNLCGSIAREFIGKPYVAHTLEDSVEMITVNIDQLDCTTFVETVLALAYTVNERRSSWHDFVFNLERIRYRGGQLNGYGSRLHYICDWMADNTYRGNLEDATKNMPKVFYVTRSIDFMSTHRDRYPALKDSVEFERIKNTEIGYRNHRFPYIKTNDLGNKTVKAALRDGDAIAFVSNLKDLDVTHMGFIVMVDGEPHVLHASGSHGKVEITEQPLQEFMKKNRQFIGIRVIRLKE